MNRFVVAPEAEQDVFKIWLYLLQGAGRETADRIENDILGAFASLAAVPGRGHRRSDLTDRDVFFHTVYQ